MTPTYTSLNKAQLEALVRLGNTNDFKIFLDALSILAEEKNEVLVMKNFENPGQMQSLQGEVRALVTLISTIADAPKQVEKINNPRGKP